LLLASAATLLAQPTIPGAWSISGDVQGYRINESCTFIRGKDKISGRCERPDGKVFDTTVTVSDKKVFITHGGEYQGQALTLTFTGTWNDKGEISGDIDVEPMQVSGSFTAKKNRGKIVLCVTIALFCRDASENERTPDEAPTLVALSVPLMARRWHHTLASNAGSRRGGTIRPLEPAGCGSLPR